VRCVSTRSVKLFNYWRSSSSYRVRLALHFKALPFEYIAVHLAKGEQHQSAHLERNPLHTVPLLEVEEGGHTIHIPQSVAIVEYLEERYPEKPLFPKDLSARAAMRALVEQINSGIQPFHNLSTLKYVKDTLHSDEKQFAGNFLHAGLDQLEALARRTAGTFMVGDQFTWADACLLPQLYGARRFSVSETNYPLLARIEARALALDFVQLAIPERQIDAQPTS